MSRWRTIPKLLLGILLVVGLVKLLFVWEQGIILRPETFSMGDWGEQPGQFGKVETADGGWYGPRHFSVTDGELFIADPVNERIQIFRWGNESQVIETVKLPSMRGLSGIGRLTNDDFLLQDAESGILHLFADGRWREWATEIKPPAETTLILPDGLITVEGSAYHAAIWLTAQGEIWQLWRLTAGGSAQLLINWSDEGIPSDVDQSVFVLDSQVFASVMGFEVSSTGSIALQVVEREDLTPAVVILDARSRMQTFRVPDATTATLQLVGLDRSNNAYLSYGDRLRIYQSNGRVVGEAELPTANLLVSLQLDEQGDLFALVHSEQGVDLIRYRRLTTGRIALRWASVDEEGKRLPS